MAGSSTAPVNDQRIAQQVSGSAGGVTVTSDWNKIVNFFTGNSHAYRSMSQGNRDKYDEYKKDLESAIKKGDRTAASTALKGMANTMRSDLTGQTDAQTRAEMQGVINACDNLSKEVKKSSFNLRDLNVRLISENSTDGSDVNTAQNDALIATFSEDGTATGKIKDLAKAITELREAGYTDEQIASFGKAYDTKQGVSESAAAINKASQPLAVANATEKSKDVGLQA